MTGWIKLHRQITENELYFSEPFNKLHAWMDLMLLATHIPRTVFIRGNEVNLVPGELCYSQESLAKRWKWNYKTVVKFLTWLENRQMLVIRKTAVITVITIKNWSIYQDTGEQKGDQKADRTVTNKNDKNIKNYLNAREGSVEVRKCGGVEANNRADVRTCGRADEIRKRFVIAPACPGGSESSNEAITGFRAGEGNEISDPLSELRPHVCTSARPHDNTSRPDTSNKIRRNDYGKNIECDPYSVKSRLSYRYDPDKARERYEELKKMFG